MNAEPHTHRLLVDPAHGLTRVSYGDQSHYVMETPIFYRWRLRHAIKRIIRRHDRKSLAAGRRAASVRAPSLGRRPSGCPRRGGHRKPRTPDAGRRGRD